MGSNKLIDDYRQSLHTGLHQYTLASLSVYVVEKGRSAPFTTPYMIGREDKRTNNRAQLLEAWLALTRVKYHDNLQV